MQTGYSFGKALLVSLYYGFHYPLQQFFDFRILLLAAAAFLPLRAAARRPRRNYRHPLAFGLLSYLAASLSFLTPLYRWGGIPAGIWSNGLYVWYVLIVWLNEWYLLGYIENCILRPEAKESLGGTGFRLPVKWAGRGLWAICLAGLIPIFLYARYLFPQADDLIYGADAHLAWEHTHSLWAVLKAAWSVVKSMYLYWQGTYSSIFAMSLQPGIFGERFYALTPFLLTGILALGLVYFLRVLCRQYLKMERGEWSVASALLLLVSVQCVISKPSAFFWFNGAVHYMFAYGVCLLFAGCLLSLAPPGGGSRRRSLLTCSACVCGGWAGGGNLVSALLTAVCLASFLALLALGLLLSRQKKAKGAIRPAVWGGALRRIALPSLCFAAGFLVNAAAPGNTARADFTGAAAGVLETILSSFYHCVRLVAGEWFNWPVMAFLLLLLPFLWRAVQRTAFGFRFPGLVTAYSYCVLSSMFAPSLFAMQTVEAGRYQNLIFITFLLLAFGNEYYWLGWLWRKKRRAAGAQAAGEQDPGSGAQRAARVQSGCLSPGASRYVAAIAAMSVLAAVMTAGTEPHTFTASAAAASLVSGEAQEYAAQMQENFDRLKAAGGEAVLEPVTVQPFLTTSPEIDVWYAGAKSYFEKEKIVMEAE